VARIARVVVPGIAYHVVQRGVRRMDVFFSDDDREQYLSFLSEAASKHALEFLAWCLMSNHAHFVVVPHSVRSLAVVFGEAHRRYTRMVNFREGWRGHLWQERFHSYPLDDSHLLAAVRYVEMNPVRASLVFKPEDWRWSSAHYHLGLSAGDRLVRKRKLLALVNNWQTYLKGTEEDEADKTELHLRTGRPMGPSAFLEKLEKLVGRHLRPNKGGWPRGKKRK